MSDSLNSAHDQLPQKVTLDVLEELDFDVIEDTPWAQALWTNVEDHTKKGFLHWCKIVKSVAGTKEEQLKEWSKLYGQALDEILCDMVLEVLMIQKHTIEKIEELFKRLHKVCMELHQPMPQKIGEKKRSLYEEQEHLMQHVQKYEAMANAKKQELKALSDKQQQLCIQLSKEPKAMLHYPPLPTPQQLDDFRKHIEELEAEVFEREEQYCQIRHDILMYAEDLKYKPTCDFEKEVLSSDQFLVTNGNMEKLKFFAKCLKDCKKTTEEEISQFRHKIENLWKMLDIDLRDRDEFRTHYTGNSLDTLSALRDEVKRCEEIRKSNLKTFVEKQRLELESLWQLCHCSDEERKQFKYFENDCYTEDLLDIHELEIQKWKKYYDENARLLELLEKHEKLWTKVNDLEERAADPKRYKNRGGELLKEEKNRNVLSKQIPVIEEEILVLCDEYRNNNGGASFLTFGRTPEEYIESIHAELVNKRKLKLSARKMQRENVPPRTPAKSTMNLFPSSSLAITPNSVTPLKRTILTTPNTENIKRMKISNLRRPINKTKTPTTVPKIKTTYTAMTLPSQRRKSRASLDKSKRRRSIKKNKGNDSVRRVLAEDVSMRTYSDFQNELSCRNATRSTLLPETPTCSSSKKGAFGSAMKTRSRTAASPMPYSIKDSKQYKRTPFKV